MDIKEAGYWYFLVKVYMSEEVKSYSKKTYSREEAIRKVQEYREVRLFGSPLHISHTSIQFLEVGEEIK